MQEQLHNIKTKDSESIALWKLSPTNDLNKHIFLIHGAFSNRTTFNGIASFLCDRGYTCWIIEWRNHGESSKSKKKYNLETVAKYDLNSTFEFLFKTIKLDSIDCISHSGGGIILTMFLIHHPTYRSKINSITLFAVQAFGAGAKFERRAKILMGKYVAAILGKIPAKTAGSVESSESYYTIKQWFDWNLNNNFVGENNFDYLEKMQTIKIPILSICSKGDGFVAPRKGCEEYLNAFKNNENRLYYCSIENGSLENYNHSRIILSQNAQKELYPIVLNWIAKRKLLPTT